MKTPNMTIGCITQLTETGVKQTVDWLGDVTTRAVNVQAAQMEEGVRAKLIELGWTPPRDPAMTTTEEVPMPEPDIYRYNHWIDGPRQTWSSIRLDHSFTLPGVIGYVQGEPHFSLPKLIAYADARCAKLQAERDAYKAADEAMQEEVGRLHAEIHELKAERDALAEKAKAMEDDTRRLDSGAIRFHERDEYGDVYAVVYSGVDLRAAIDAAGDQP